MISGKLDYKLPRKIFQTSRRYSLNIRQCRDFVSKWWITPEYIVIDKCLVHDPLMMLGNSCSVYLALLLGSWTVVDITGLGYGDGGGGGGVLFL